MKTKPTQHLLAALLSAAFTTILHPQTSAFTYQGQLTDNGALAAGLYDFTFTLYDSSNGVTAVAGPITNSPTAVTNGLFTITLDFGTGVFDGGERWLEIGVVTNGGGVFTILSPRQPIAFAPYAIRARSADTATTADLAEGVVEGTVSAGQLAPGAAAANLAASGRAGVASGGLVLSETENAALAGAVYANIGSTLLSGRWQNHTHHPPPAAHRQHKAVWTENEMIVWVAPTAAANLPTRAVIPR